MSYDLVFWKQRPDSTAAPREIYEALTDERRVAGLEPLHLDDIFRAIEAAFPGFQTQRAWNGGDRGAFEFSASEFFVCFSCHGMSGDDMNTIIDIGARFGCPLYDPQVDQRFQLP